MSKFFKPRLTGDRARYTILNGKRWSIEFFHWGSVPASNEFIRREGGGFELTIKLLPYLDISLIKSY